MTTLHVLAESYLAAWYSVWYVTVIS